MGQCDGTDTTTGGILDETHEGSGAYGVMDKYSIAPSFTSVRLVIDDEYQRLDTEVASEAPVQCVLPTLLNRII